MAKKVNQKIQINCLKVVLAKKGMMNKELAEMVGVTENTISRICQNTSQPTLGLLYKMAIALDVNIKDLLNDTK